MDVLRTIVFGIFSDTGIVFGYLTSFLKREEVTQFAICQSSILWGKSE